MTEKAENTKQKFPPLWGAASNTGSAMGACSRCSGLSKLLAELKPGAPQDSLCSSCSSLNEDDRSMREKAK
ncbi:hypothetical protein SAMN04515695_0031 [Pseudovibrio sp. Tun.PSC04-5.I4]|nr:hypothetical protein SAMN04515695_0031 [Pseudovibrio sp. Tun.PSC04-5.I4]